MFTADPPASGAILHRALRVVHGRLGTGAALFFLWSFLGGAAGCGSAGDARCTKGDSYTCNAGSGCRLGRSVCEHPADGFSPCRCIDAPSKVDEAPKPDAGPMPPLPELGQPCRRDAECAAGAFCVQPSGADLAGGGPPHGICAADCSSNEDICREFSGATCVHLALPVRLDGGTARDGTPADAGAGRSSLCFEQCTVGSGASTKCHAAPSVACEPLSGGSSGAFCRPACSTNRDCPERACNLRTGVCTDEVAGVDSTLGMACDARVTSNDCDGLCVSLDSSHGVCSHRCIFGDSADCAGTDGIVHAGGCVLSTPGGDIGDVGYCAQLCDCPGDCRDPDFVCDPFEDRTLETAFGRKGVCTPRALALRTPITC
jgi:hypothetical protein